MKQQQTVIDNVNVMKMAVYADKNGTSDSSRHNWHTLYDGARQNSIIARRRQTAAELLVTAT